MKKIIFSAVVALGLFVVSCSSPKEKAADIIKEATEQVKEAKTMDDLQKIAEDMTTKIDDLKLSEEEKKELAESPEIKALNSEFLKVSIPKALELAGK